MIGRPLSTGLIRRRLITAGLVRLMAVAGLLVLAVLGAAGTASAHSQLLRTDPADGSQVGALPERITLTFNQNVLGLGDVLQVTGPGGSASDGAPTVVNNQVSQAILPGSPAGAYTVLWRVTSADGHPISGRFAFTAAAGSSGTAPPVAASGSAADATSESSGGAGMVWLLIGCGVVIVAAGIFLAVRRPAPTRADDETTVSG